MMASNASVMDSHLEWAIARDVQQRFMQHPVQPVDTLDYSARCRQVNDVGGDCYDLVPLADRGLALAIGDASGKGLAAALMISNVQSSLRTAALFAGNDGAALLGAVNRQVYKSSLEERYATLFYGVFDGTARTLRYVNAGHNPPMIIRASGSIVWLETGGAPVGLFPDWDYDEAEVQLCPGDLLVAYTDGVIEAVNPEGNEWGVQRLRRAVTESRGQSAEDIVHSIFTAVDEFSAGHATDDATVVVVRVQSNFKR
jgi:sigma-B regulation protein RsbU (phosphoserine phosphatase)